MEKDNRRWNIHQCECGICRQHPYGSIAKQHKMLNRMLATANEKQRRLIVGFLAQQYGRGGIAQLTTTTGMSPHTIRRGQTELKNTHSFEKHRVRCPGGGRKRIEKKLR